MGAVEFEGNERVDPAINAVGGCCCLVSEEGRGKG